MERTMISKTGLRAGAVLLASLALAGCSKDPGGVTVDPGRKGTILSIAEVNYAVSGGGSKSAVSAQGGDRAGAASGDGTPQTRAIVDGGGSTFFTDRDRLGLFLRGEGYEDVDNRIVQLDYPGEGPQKKWNITGEDITLYSNEATVTAYFPYSEYTSMSAVPLNPGPYDVNTNDLVWQRDKVHSTHTQAMFIDMQHAMTRVKIRLNRSKPLTHKVGDVVDGGVVYWVNSENNDDFRVVALDESSKAWAASTSYALGEGAQSQIDRNGAAIMTLARQYSANHSGSASGTFATDFPAFSYCYNKTPEGTWYLPSKQELTDLYAARGSVESVITDHNGTAFSDAVYWLATEFNDYSSAAWVMYFGNEGSSFNSDSKTTSYYCVRCVRSPLASEGPDPGGYAGEGKIMGVQIADAEGVSADDRVVFFDGKIDLEQAIPVVTGTTPGSVFDMTNKTLTEEGVLYDLLLLPVDKLNEGKVMLNVVIDDKLISAPFPVDVIDKWEAGKAYTYEVEVRNGEAQVVFGKATVTPWNYGGSISGSLDPSNPEYGGGDVQDWGGNDWETEEGGDEPVTGEIAAASLVPPPADNVIPAEGGEYSVRLTGNWTGSVSVRMFVGGNIGGLSHAVCSDGAATVAFTVPAYTSYYSSRTVTFEYLWNGKWTKIGDVSTQVGYNITRDAVTPEGDIPGAGGTYRVTLTGVLPAAGVEVRAKISGADPVTGKVTASGTPVTLKIPTNTTGVRTVTFEYLWDKEWKKIGDDRTQGLAVGSLYGGGVIYWVNPNDWKDFRVVAMDEALTKLCWAANNSYVLGEDAQDVSARNGADIWKIAKAYSDAKRNGESGDFATDYPAFAYCYNKTDGGVAKGTWYLPSHLETKELAKSQSSIESVLADNGAVAFTKTEYWTSTEVGTKAFRVVFTNAGAGDYTKTGVNRVRCIRGR